MPRHPHNATFVSNTLCVCHIHIASPVMWPMCPYISATWTYITIVCVCGPTTMDIRLNFIIQNLLNGRQTTNERCAMLCRPRRIYNTNSNNNESLSMIHSHMSSHAKPNQTHSIWSVCLSGSIFSGRHWLSLSLSLQAHWCWEDAVRIIAVNRL